MRPGGCLFTERVRFDGQVGFSCCSHLGRANAAVRFLAVASEGNRKQPESVLSETELYTDPFFSLDLSGCCSIFAEPVQAARFTCISMYYCYSDFLFLCVCGRVYVFFGLHPRRLTGYQCSSVCKTLHSRSLHIST